MKIKTKVSGFTLVELMISITVAAIIGFVIIVFAKDIISLNASSQAGMTGFLESRKILSVMVSELRSTTSSALGSYAIESASTSTVVFFADINADNVADRVRYSLNAGDNTIERGVVLAEGEPPAYDLGSESISTLMTNLVNGTSTALFEYYDSSYAGTSSPLSIPVNIQDIRLVKITAKIDKDPNRAPAETVITSQATLRNLKNNEE